MKKPYIYKKDVISLIHAIREVYGSGWYGRIQLVEILSECENDISVGRAIYKRCKKSKLIKEEGGIVFLY